MEPPSPLISWVNPFPSRFINRAACFPRKMSYFCKSRMSWWKNKIGWSRTQKPVIRPFSFFTLRPFLHFTAAGIWVSWNKSWWITRPRLSMKRWDKGSELRITERLSLRVFFCFFLPTYIPHLSKHREKSRRLSVPLISRKTKWIVSAPKELCLTNWTILSS